MRKASTLTLVLVALLVFGATVAFAQNASNFLAGVVTDTGGIDDRSFNASAWQGLEDAKAAYGITAQYLQSTNQSDYAPNIQAFIQKKANIIVTVGFLMGDATKAAAEANPDQKFAIVDYTYDPALPNVLGLIYNTNQAAFLGGYLAAAMSKTGSVATFGGMKIPTVTIYMDGFAAGVRYYNQQMNASVKVLGWNPEKSEGTFTNDFTNQAKGKTVTEALMNQGADIIFPVAGSVGLGSAAAAQQHDASSPDQPVYMEWVDTDGCVSAPQYCSLFLTSVTKGIASSVKAAVGEVRDGSFKGGNYVGTLENGGTGLAPFHDFDSKIPDSVKSELQTIKKGIIDGSISVDPKSYPAP